MATFHRRKPKNNVAQFPRSARPTPATVPTPVKPKRRRGIYLLPNAFTTAALFSGFFAIVQAMNQRFEIAGYAIFIAAVLDSLDGRVARLTNTQSDFGAEYDSLSDMVAFGVAPALVIYQWSLLGLDKWGWLAAFVYVAGAGLRLARFNTNIEIVDKRFFQGLPSPAAAAMVAGFVLVLDNLRYTGAELMWESFCVTLYAGLSMVSNSPFYSFKVVNLRKSVPFVYALVVVLLFVVILINPPRVLFGAFIAYALSGHAIWVWKWLRNRSPGEEPPPTVPPTETE
jgi:CDP-diacylglycerol--serine O-phosphatidyltransferase